MISDMKTPAESQREFFYPYIYLFMPRDRMKRAF